jgi:hypothetical protein
MYQQFEDEKPEPTFDWSPWVVIGSLIGAACVFMCCLKCCTGCNRLCNHRKHPDYDSLDDDIFEVV